MVSQQRHVLECYNMISRLDGCDSLTNGLDDTSSFVTENDWESSLGVLAGQSVCIYCSISSVVTSVEDNAHTCVADTGVVDLNADFVSLWWCDLNVLDAQFFAGLPRNCSLRNVSIVCSSCAVMMCFLTLQVMVCTE
jgi:hypothetical protein